MAFVTFKAPLSSPLEYVEPRLYADTRTTARVAVVLADRKTAVNLTGLTARLIVRRDAQDEAVLFDIAGVVFGAAEDGLVDFDIKPEIIGIPAMLPFRSKALGELRLVTTATGEIVGRARLAFRVEGGVG